MQLQWAAATHDSLLAHSHCRQRHSGGGSIIGVCLVWLPAAATLWQLTGSKSPLVGPGVRLGVISWGIGPGYTFVTESHP